MNTNVKKPISPHLQVYRLPLSAWLSITHRATGLVMSIGALLLIGVLAALADGPDTYAVVRSLLQTWVAQLFLFALTFALYFHCCNGVRHLFWDLGIGFELKVVDKTAKWVLILSTLLTLATWVVALRVN